MTGRGHIQPCASLFAQIFWQKPPNPRYKRLTALRAVARIETEAYSEAYVRFGELRWLSISCLVAGRIGGLSLVRAVFGSGFRLSETQIRQAPDGAVKLADTNPHNERMPLYAYRAIISYFPRRVKPFSS